MLHNEVIELNASLEKPDLKLLTLRTLLLLARCYIDVVTLGAVVACVTVICGSISCSVVG
jgi:hypothetical protein